MQLLKLTLDRLAGSWALETVFEARLMKKVSLLAAGLLKMLTMFSDRDWLCEQIDLKAESRWQLKPGSMVHSGLHPSPGSRFPSSHCSGETAIPSEQMGEQTPPIM